MLRLKNERIKFILMLLFCALFAFSVFYFYESVSVAALQSMTLCVRLLLPSLFPFLVLSNFIISSGLAQKADRHLVFVMEPLFRLNGACSCAFLLGIICGFPVGAKAAVDLYRSGLCSRNHAQKMLSFCSNASPAFIISAVGCGMYGSHFAGLTLYVCHILSSILTGIVFRFYSAPETPAGKRSKRLKSAPKSIPLCLSESIKNAAQSIIVIFGFVIFFAVVIRLLYDFKVIPALSSMLNFFPASQGIKSNCAEGFLAGIFEITTGINKVADGSFVSFGIIGSLLAWSGLSVHFQVISFIGDCGLSVKMYIAGKLLNSLLAGLITAAAVSVLPISKQAFSANHDVLAGSFSGSFYSSCAVALPLLMFFISFALRPRITPQKKSLIKKPHRL